MKKKLWLLTFILLSFVGINNVEALNCSLVDPNDNNRVYNFKSDQEYLSYNGKKYKLSSKANSCPDAAVLAYNSGVTVVNDYYMTFWNETDGSFSKLLDGNFDLKSDFSILVAENSSMAFCRYDYTENQYLFLGYYNDNAFSKFVKPTINLFTDVQLSGDLMRRDVYILDDGTPKCPNIKTVWYGADGSVSLADSSTKGEYITKLAFKIEHGKNNKSNVSSCKFGSFVLDIYSDNTLGFINITVPTNKYNLQFDYNDLPGGKCPVDDGIIVNGSNVYLGNSGEKGRKFDYSGNGVTGETIKSEQSSITGAKYEELLCELSPYLKKSGVGNNISLQIDSEENVPIGSWQCNTTYSCTGNDCEKNFEYEMNQKVKAVANYCNSIYDNYTNAIKNGDSNVTNRVKECISFDRYYQELVKGGYIDNLSDGCGILSGDAWNLIQDVLNIIKIAGPLIAIGLGMIDFAKAVVAGDPDKEFKSAGVRFLKRIIAAIVLLLLPIILSFIMNIFLKNKPGYDADNPFCDVVDWNEVNNEVIESENQ